MIKRFIPNIFTFLNMLSGCVAVVLAVQDQLVSAAIFVGLGIFFDFFDGFFARLFKVSGEIGVQLDSLADMITSGLVPGIVMMQLLSRSLENYNLLSTHSWSTDALFPASFPYLAFLGLLITAASGYRLAKFNIDKRQTSSFIGLPTPANAILILSFPLIATYQASPRVMSIIFSPWFLAGLIGISCFLLNAELPLFGLKFKSAGFKENWFRYVFIAFCLFALGALQFMALPIIILVYVLFSAVLDFLRVE